MRLELRRIRARGAIGTDWPREDENKRTEAAEMIPRTLFVRFYKSFNYDYLRKCHPKAKPDPWEKMEDLWYPHVRIPLDPQITTMVGANESGKSQLLTAIEKAISGEGIERSDFCRYSPFLTVETGQWKWPEFGIEWVSLTESESKAVCEACGTTETRIHSFHMFRTAPGLVVAYLPDRPDSFRVEGEALKSLQQALPRTFRIDRDIALPDRVSLEWLGSSDLEAKGDAGLSRAARMNLVQQGPGLLRRLTDQNAAQKQIAEISQEATRLLKYEAGAKDTEDPRSMQLARDLLVKVAKVDQEVLVDLYESIRDGKSGHAKGLVQKLNDHLSSRLNFPFWWTQDREFSLVVDAQESELVFTIRDRTGTDYSFNERSSGLKYFLSYFVQSQAHEKPSGRGEILLMDEPDAYLSAQAQQDLLKILHSFAFPSDPEDAVPVIYVTHSPFLIDKNHAERIRVLEKGAGDEGTRVVANASKNHYEPLRSALGGFVAETAFIGNCNLMVEGPSDQVLLAGAAGIVRRLQHAQSETLDLNTITLVPCGSASHVPYMVYLARGRDQDRPAVIVLLDADVAGREAAEGLKRGGPHRKQLLDDKYVLLLNQIPELPDGLKPKCLEDLIPLKVAAEAGAAYLHEFTGEDLTDACSGVIEQVRGADKILEALQGAFSTASKSESVHIDKVGFARAVVQVMERRLAADAEDPESARFAATMRAVFRAINGMRREAMKELGRATVGRRIEREKRRFLDDHPTSATREEAAQFLDDLSEVLDETTESDDVLVELNKLRREFSLGEDLHERVADYERFRAGLVRVKYAHELAQLSNGETDTSTSPSNPEPDQDKTEGASDG